MIRRVGRWCAVSLLAVLVMIMAGNSASAFYSTPNLSWGSSSSSCTSCTVTMTITAWSDTSSAGAPLAVAFFQGGAQTCDVPFWVWSSANNDNGTNWQVTYTVRVGSTNGGCGTINWRGSWSHA